MKIVKQKILHHLLYVCIFLIGSLGIANANTNVTTTNPSINIQNILLAPGSDSEKIPVKIAFRVINLSDIDQVSQRYNVVGYLLAEWKDPRLAFTPQNAEQRFIVYHPSEIWIPYFNFANGVVPHSSFDITIRAYPDGTIRYYERASAQLSSNLFLHTFPFDLQTLEIRMQPFIGQEDKVEFILATEEPPFSDEEGAYSSLAEWRVKKIGSEVDKIRGFTTEFINEIKFSIDIERRSTFYIWKVFLPLLLMVILSWTVLWFEPKELSSQTQVSVTTILTVIAFSFAISLTLPKVPYLTFIDAFFLTCYFFVFATAIEITALHLLVRRNHIEKSYKFQRLSQILFPSTFILVNIFLVLYFWKIGI